MSPNALQRESEVSTMLLQLNSHSKEGGARAPWRCHDPCGQLLKCSEVRFVLKCCGACMHGRGHVCRAAASSEALFVHRGAEGSKISKMAGAPRANRRAIRRAHGRAEPAAHEAPHLRRQEGDAVGRERARAARGWGQGAGAGWRRLAEHARRQGKIRS